MYNNNIYADKKEEIIEAAKELLPKYEAHFAGFPRRFQSNDQMVANHLSQKVVKSVLRFSKWMIATMRGRVDSNWYVDEKGQFHGHVSMIGDHLTTLYKPDDLRCLQGYRYWTELFKASGVDLNYNYAMINFMDTENTRNAIEKDLSVIGAHNFKYESYNGKLLSYEFICKAEDLNRSWRIQTVPMGFRISRIRDDSLIWVTSVQMCAITLDNMIEGSMPKDCMAYYLYAFAHLTGQQSIIDKEMEEIMYKDLHMYDSEQDAFSTEDIVNVASAFRRKVENIPFVITSMRVVDRTGGHIAMHPAMGERNYDHEFRTIVRDGERFCLKTSENIAALDKVLGCNYSFDGFEPGIIDSVLVFL